MGYEWQKWDAICNKIEMRDTGSHLCLHISYRIPKIKKQIPKVFLNVGIPYWEEISNRTNKIFRSLLKGSKIIL